MKFRETLPLLLILLAITVNGCSNNEPAKSADPEMVDSTDLPDSEVHGARIELYDRGQVTARINADYIRKFEDKDSTMGYQLTIVTYDSIGHAASTIVGDSGIIWEGRGELEIFGNVTVLDSDSSHLETDYLTWNKKTRKMRTDAFVRITDTEGNVITGWGMEAEHNPRRYRILRQVSGNFKEPDSARK